MVDKRLDQLAEFSGCPPRWPGAGAPACRKRLRELGLFCPEKRWLQRLSKTYEEVSKKIQLGSAQDILAHTHVQSYKHYCWDFSLDRRRKSEDIPWPCLEFSTTEGIMQDKCLKYEYEYSVSKSIGDASKASLPASRYVCWMLLPSMPRSLHLCLVTNLPDEFQEDPRSEYSSQLQALIYAEVQWSHFFT